MAPAGTVPGLGPEGFWKKGRCLMAGSYIPLRDSDLGQWAANFSTLISSSPASYGLTAGDASAIATYVNAFNAALTVVNNPGTKTAASVATKDGCKAAMLDIIRPYAMQVRNNRGVSNAEKTALGLRVVDQTKSPVPAPSSSPSVDVAAATRGEHLLRIRDAASPAGRGKPAGVTGLQLYIAIAAMAVDDPGAATFKAFVTKQPYVVQFDHADSGKIATYHARWQNGKGETGPWSNPVSFIVYA